MFKSLRFMSAFCQITPFHVIIWGDHNLISNRRGHLKHRCMFVLLRIQKIPEGQNPHEVIEGTSFIFRLPGANRSPTRSPVRSILCKTRREIASSVMAATRRGSWRFSTCEIPQDRRDAGHSHGAQRGDEDGASEARPTARALDAICVGAMVAAPHETERDGDDAARRSQSQSCIFREGARRRPRTQSSSHRPQLPSRAATILALCTMVSLQPLSCAPAEQPGGSMFLTNPANMPRAESCRALSFKPRTPCAPDTIGQEKTLRALTRALPGPRARALAGGKNSHAVVMLDLDKTSLYGNDGNDLPLALQWEDKQHAVVKELYRLIVSPNIRPALQLVREQAQDVTVVIYTRRPQVVHYTSPYRQDPVHLLFNAAWHDGRGQLLLPGHVETAADMMAEYTGVELLQEERRDVEKILERLLGARDAVASELGLRAAPTVVVTGQDKKVEGTATALGLPTEQAVLFDDNPQLASDPKVVTVEPLLSLPPHQRQRVLDFMQLHLPAEQLSPDLVSFLLGASAAECSVRANPASGAIEWNVPVAATPLRLWANPTLRGQAHPQRWGHALHDWSQPHRSLANVWKGSSSFSLCAAA